MSFKYGVHWCNRGWLPFCYCYCPDEKGWNRLMKHLGTEGEPYPESSGRMTSVRSVETGEISLIVTFSDQLPSKCPITITGIVVHEATHVWQEVQKHIGEEDPGWEMEAYAVQAIYSELLYAMLKVHPDLLKNAGEIDA